VKAHQTISHKFRFRPEPSIKAFEQMKEICKILKARILLIQTPGSLRSNKLKDAEKFFRKISREGLVIVWETRGPAWKLPNARKKLEETLRELDISHVTDPFKATPVYTSEVAYFRLHGLGKQLYYYQFTDEELRWLHDLLKPLETEGKEVYVLFNNLAMFHDAARFKHFIETASFPSLTGAMGLESVKSVIQKTRYPTTKSLLLKRLGWRLIELKEGKQTRLNELLKNLPPKSYENMEEVLQELRRLLQASNCS
jgi:uncharacterized protein YecE (DUF72 family)